MQMLKIVEKQSILKYGRKRKRIFVLPLASPFWEGLIPSRKDPTSEWKEVEEQEEQKSQSKNFSKCLQTFENFVIYCPPPDPVS